MSDGQLDEDARPPRAPVPTMIPRSPTEASLEPFGESQATTLHELIEMSVWRTPEATAVIGVDGVLTYRELYDRAAALATQLRQAAVGLESRVAVCVEEGVDLAVAFLGVLIAGAAFVPIEPAWPRRHREQILVDAGVDVAVVSYDRIELFGATVTCIDVDVSRTPVSSAPPTPGVSPDNLAYVMYTSGSTGAPKGVMVTHAGAVNYLRWMAQEFGVRSTDRVLQTAASSFDVSVWELFLPMLRGGVTVIAPREAKLDPRLLVRLCRDTHVSIVHLMPAMLHLVMDDGMASLPDLRVVACSSDVFPVAIANQARRQLQNDVVIVHLYGVTEVSIESTFYRVTGVIDAQTVPVGMPLDETTIYILDESLSRVAAGAIGEIFIGGTSVTRGYLGLSAHTAAVFLPDPYSGKVGSRMYRTGDLGRIRPDGDLEFLGRIDSQIKIRGHRVEPAHVESVLLGHPFVAQAVVAPTGERDAVRLVAYVVPTDPAFESAELLGWVAERLPDVMTPVAVVSLAELPTLSNGKVDRKRLPPPPRPGRLAAQPTGVEAQLAAIWSEVLNVDVGLDADFIEIGGDSLAAMRIVSRCRRQLGLTITMPDFFERRTLRRIAGALESEESASAIDASEDGSSPSGASPLSASQARLWYLSQLEETSEDYVSSALFRVRGPLDATALGAAIRDVVGRHDVLRSVIADTDGVPSAYPLPIENFGVELIELPDDLVDSEATALAIATAAATDMAPLDRGPLFRVVLVAIGSDDHYLVVSGHHIVADGHAMAILLRQLGDAYGCRLSMSSPPGLRGVQFAAYVDWELSQRSSAWLARDAAFWRKTLDGLPAPVSLAGASTIVRDARDGSVPVVVAQETLEQVRALARSRGASPFMVLLAAWSAFVGRITGAEDVAVGTPVFGRLDAVWETVVGNFANLVVVRTRVDRRRTFEDHLIRTRDAALGAYDHQALPFDRVVAHVAPPRDEHQPPFFHVVFVVDQPGECALALPGVDVENVAPAMRRAKFELALHVLLDDDGSFSSRLEYRGSVCDEALATGWADAFVRFLGTAVDEPSGLIGSLPVSPSAVRPHAILHVLDEQGDLCPPGVPGTLHIELDHAISTGPVPTTQRAVLSANATLELIDDEPPAAEHVGPTKARQPPSARGTSTHDRDVLEAIMETWRSLCGRNLDPEIDVFEQGVHSLLAARFTARLRQRIPHLVRLRSVMAHRRPHDLAIALAGQTPRSEERTTALGALSVGGQSLSPQQARLWTLAEAYPGDTSYNVQFALSIDGELDADALSLAFQDVVFAHEALQTRFVQEGRSVIRERDTTATANFRVVTSDLESEAASDYSLPFALESAPLIRATLVLGPASPVLLITAHHIVVDATSVDVIIEDLTQAYRSRRTGRAGLGSRPSLSDAARREDAALAPRREDDLRFWRAALSGVAPFDLSTGATRPRSRPVGGHVVRRTVNADARKAAWRAVDEARVTPFVACLGALLTVLRAWTGRADVAVATDVDTRPDDARAVGFFVNQVVVRHVADPDAAIATDLGALQETWADAVDHGAVPFDEVVREVAPRSRGQAPFTSVKVTPAPVRSSAPDGSPSLVPVGDALCRRITPKRELTVLLEIHESAIVVEYEFAESVLDEAWIDAFHRAVELVLLGYGAAIEHRVADAIAAVPAPPKFRAEVVEALRPAATAPIDDRCLRLVLAAWAEVFEQSDLTADDDFFLLGGHSLSAVRVLNRLRAVAPNVSIEDVFDYSVAADLARLVAVRQIEADAQPVDEVAAVRTDVADTGEYEASHSQRRMYFIDQLVESDVSYIVPYRLMIDGDIDPARLRAAVAAVVAEVNVLRTVFVPRGQRLIAQIRESMPVPFANYDLSCLDPAAADVAADRILAAEQLEPFSLAEGPLVRLTLLRLAPGRHEVFLCMHHIATDLWSGPLLLERLAAHYLGESTAPHQLTYADYAAAEHAMLHTEASHAHERYFLDALTPPPPPIDLRCARSRPVVQHYRGDEMSFVVAPEVTARLRAYAKAERATLFILTMGAFAQMLGDFSGERDLVIGVPVANRPAVSFEAVIGPFSNMLPIRVQLPADESCTSVVAEARRACLGAYAHQVYPFDALVKALNPPRTLDRSPVFSTTVAWEHLAPGRRFAVGSSEWVVAAVRERTSKFDLSLTAGDSADGLHFALTYNTDLFEAADIQAMADAFRARLIAYVE